MPKNKKILYVYEYTQSGNPDKNPDTLWSNVQKNLVDVEVTHARGLSKEYKGGGLRTNRLLNFLYMHIACPFKIIFANPDLIFVRTSPPLMQISYAFWGMLMRKKVVMWLMDYHPVLGLRASKQNSFKYKVWRFFDVIDKKLLQKMCAVVCIDVAMSELIKERAPSVKTIVSPTFNISKAQWLDLSHPEKSDEIKLLYSGNLGRAHSTINLENLLKTLSKSRKVSLTYCGKAKESQELLSEVCKRAGTQFYSHKFIEHYEDLGAFYKENKFDYGVVLLNDELKGIVSPSKFSGYTSFGLPIIYLGPKGTNADIVCSRFNAGISANSESEVAQVAQKILDANTQSDCAKNTKDTLEYFSPKASELLAKELQNLL